MSEERLPEYQPFLPGLKPELPIGKLAEGISDRELCEELADRLAKLTNQSSLPIGIEAIAKFCGIANITDIPNLRAQGLLQPIKDGFGYYHSQLLSDMDKEERDITLGHEIAHLLLKEMGRRSTRRNIYGNNDPVEQFCDRFARAILAPRSLLAPEVKALNHPDQDHIWQYDQANSLTNELWKLLHKTGLPVPYLAQRLAEDLKLSANTLMSIVMGPKRGERDPHRRDGYQDQDHVFWVNTPFQLWYPEMKRMAEWIDKSDVIDAVNKHFAEEIYNRYLVGLETQAESCRFSRKAYVCTRKRSKPKYDWLDIFEADIRGVLICQDSVPTYALAALKFEKTAEVKSSWRTTYPYKQLLKHLIRLTPTGYNSYNNKGFIFELG